MLKAVGKFIWLFIYNILEWTIRIIYLSLPLWFHMFALQMRQKINPVTTLPTFVNENSTWTVVYPGLVMVNTEVGAVRKRIQNFKNWVKKYTWLWVTIAVLLVIALLTFIALRLV